MRSPRGAGHLPQPDVVVLGAREVLERGAEGRRARRPEDRSEAPSWWRTEAFVSPLARISVTDGRRPACRSRAPARARSPGCRRPSRSRAGGGASPRPRCGRRRRGPAARRHHEAATRRAGSTRRARASGLPERDALEDVLAGLLADAGHLAGSRRSGGSLLQPLDRVHAQPLLEEPRRPGPRPRTSSKVRNAGASSARSASSEPGDRSARYSSMSAASSRPIPGSRVSSPRSARAATSSASVSSVWAARW